MGPCCQGALDLPGGRAARSLGDLRRLSDQAREARFRRNLKEVGGCGAPRPRGVQYRQRGLRLGDGASRKGIRDNGRGQLRASRVSRNRGIRRPRVRGGVASGAPGWKERLIDATGQRKSEGQGGGNDWKSVTVGLAHRVCTPSWIGCFFLGAGDRTVEACFFGAAAPGCRRTLQHRISHLQGFSLFFFRNHFNWSRVSMLVG
jgi:hypothetical protein